MKASASISNIFWSWLTERNSSSIDLTNIEKRDSRSTQSSSLVESDKKLFDKLVSTIDSRISKLLRVNEILQHDSSTSPRNIDDIRSAFERERDSLNSRKTEFITYERRVQTTSDELTIVFVVQTHVLQQRDDLVYKTEEDQQFVNFLINVDFNDGLSAVTPDLIEGYLKKAFDRDAVVERLDRSTVSTQCSFLIALAHLIEKFKKVESNMTCEAHQVVYVATYLVYARDRAQISTQENDKSDMTHVNSFVCDDERLKISVHYAIENLDSEVIKYRQYLLFDENIQMNLQHFISDRRHLRNLQDWAQRNANTFREASEHHERAISFFMRRKVLHRVCKTKAVNKAANTSHEKIEE